MNYARGGIARWRPARRREAINRHPDGLVEGPRTQFDRVLDPIRIHVSFDGEPLTPVCTHDGKLVAMGSFTGFSIRRFRASH